MQQVFVSDEQLSVNHEYVTITGDDAHHIRNVLRMRPGEELRVSTESGSSFLCAIAEIGDSFVQADIRSDLATTALPGVIRIFQAIPKGDRMETVIEKVVELGASEIIPVHMKYCVVRLDEKKAESRVKRWQAISESAARQSKRSIVPRVHAPVSFEEALKELSECAVRLIPYENEKGMSGTREALQKVRGKDSIGILIGPEGGFSEEEIRSAEKTGMRISLGRRILRTDTAAIAVTAAVMLEIEEASDGSLS